MNFSVQMSISEQSSSTNPSEAFMIGHIWQTCKGCNSQAAGAFTTLSNGAWPSEDCRREAATSSKIRSSGQKLNPSPAQNAFKFLIDLSPVWLQGLSSPRDILECYLLKQEFEWIQSRWTVRPAISFYGHHVRLLEWHRVQIDLMDGLP